MADPQSGVRSTVRLYVALFLAASALFVGISYTGFRQATDHRLGMLRDEEAHAVGMRQDEGSGAIRGFVSDLLLLANLDELQAFIVDGSPNHRAGLARDLSAFLRLREPYDGVRMADESGAERFAFVRSNGSPIETSTEGRGLEGPEPAILAASGCSDGPIYATDLYLQTERGSPVRPIKSLMTLGVALHREDGSPAGKLLLDILGQSVLHDLSSMHPEPASRSMVIDRDGYWIYGGESDEKGAGLLSEQRGPGFYQAFPTEWEKIRNAKAGQFETKNGLFTYGSVDPVAGIEAAACGPKDNPLLGESLAESGPRWILVSLVPATTMAAVSTAGLGGFVALNGFGVLTLGLGGWFLLQRSLRSKRFRERVVGENRLLSSTLGRYLPKDISARLLRDPARYAKLGGEVQHVAVLFADLRGFTSFSESRSPEVVVAALNHALSELVRPVLAHHGILDKYMGDGLLAFFEPHESPADAARRALGAGREMQRAFARLRRETSMEVLGKLGLGIGISIGKAVVGNIGSEQVMNHTIIGDVVNVAARLQAVAEAGRILLTEEVYRLVAEDIGEARARSLIVKGRKQAITVYECGGADSSVNERSRRPVRK